MNSENRIKKKIWECFDVFKNYRKEIEDFANQVKGSAVKFVANIYPTLWVDWDNQKEISDHVTNLRSRYSLSI